jgi:hypothetical protein
MAAPLSSRFRFLSCRHRPFRQELFNGKFWKAVLGANAEMNYLVLITETAEAALRNTQHVTNFVYSEIRRVFLRRDCIAMLLTGHGKRLPFNSGSAFP